MRNIINRVKRYVSIAFTMLFHGMKAGNDEITSQLGAESEITQQKAINDLYSQLLNEEKTQEVKEFVDTTYRVTHESEKFVPDWDSTNFILDETGDISSMNINVKRKTRASFSPNLSVFSGDTNEIKVVQDNKKYDKHSMFYISYEDETNVRKTENFGYETLLKVKRGNFVPTFYIEKIVKKIVVKRLDDKNSIIDLYIQSEYPQFGSILRTVVNKLKNIYENKRYTDELVDIDSIRFYSDKCWSSNGSFNGMLFEYSNMKLFNIVEFDGNYIFQYKGENVTEFEYIGDKYKTKEVDEKYNKMLPKSDATDIKAIERRNKYLKDKDNEDSN